MTTTPAAVLLLVGALLSGPAAEESWDELFEAAVAHGQAKRHVESLSFLERAMQIARGFEAEDPRYGQTLRMYADTYPQAKGRGTALGVVLGEFALMERVYGPGDPRTVPTLLELGWQYIIHGRSGKGIEAYVESVSIVEPRADEFPRLHQRALGGLAEAYAREGRSAEAIELIERMDPQEVRGNTLHHWLARLYAEEERFDDAIATYESLIEAALARHGAEHERTKRFREEYRELLLILGRDR